MALDGSGIARLTNNGGPDNEQHRKAPLATIAAHVAHGTIVGGFVSLAS